MYSSSMSMAVATTLDDALRHLAARPDAMVLAGGTDAMVEFNMGHRRAASVVAVDRVRELRSWIHEPAADGGRAVVQIGAAITWTELMTEPLASWLPALAQAARTVGSPQIRNAGTIGGNIGTASPAGDGLPVLAALDAVIHLASLGGTREVPFGEFATGPKRTVVRPGELITGVTVPVLDGYQGYSKVGVRNAMVIATASLCLATSRSDRSVRVALGSVGPVILRAPEAEAFVAEHADWDRLVLDDDTVRAAAAMVAAEARPIDDHRSTAAYRRHAISVLAARQLRRAFPGSPS